MKNKQEMDKSLKTAKTIAESILSGQIDPHDGADQIAQICHDLDYPDILLDLMHIAHIQEGHEHLGYYKHNLRQGILDEARKLIEKLP